MLVINSSIFLWAALKVQNIKNTLLSQVSPSQKNEKADIVLIYSILIEFFIFWILAPIIIPDWLRLRSYGHDLFNFLIKIKFKFRKIYYKFTNSYF